jgi:adenylate cyclase
MTDRRVSDDDLHVLLAYLERLGATAEDVARASAISLGSLALDMSVRPAGAPESLAEFAERTGIPEAAARRYWTALGLPLDPPFPFPVTRDIAFAIEVMVLLEAQLGESAVLNLSRVLGSAAARLADALAETTRVGVELPQLASGAPYSEVVETYSTHARELLPTLLDVVGAVFRRHLVLVSYQLWSPDEGGTAVTLHRTVGFADLVGSTEMVRKTSPSQMAQLVRAFEQLVWDVVTAAGGRVVKLIGDEAMFVLDDASRAVEVTRELLRESPRALRIGLDHGPVVALGGDYYGSTVNLAARLVSIAPPGTAAVSEPVRAAASDTPFDLLDAAVRDFPEVRPYVLRVGSMPPS